VKRRDLLKAAVVVGAAGPRALAHLHAQTPADADYIVVGSGAGGGTVAARLAEKGFSVLVLEAGDAPKDCGNYSVPAFHPFATEDPAMRWDFWVRHYSDDKQQANDPNYCADQGGVWYPRAGTLGGCTAHNAMIFVYPSNADWDYIADLTGDRSWQSLEMWKYFQLVENCRHRPLERALRHVSDPTRHGWNGWLPVEKAEPLEALLDSQVRHIFRKSVEDVMHKDAPSRARLEAFGDPNDWRVVERDEVGARYTPLTTHGHARYGTRERLLDAQQSAKGQLRIVTNALVTRVVLDDKGTRAVGVEYQQGAHLYTADPHATLAPAPTMMLRARREIILAGGAFNTPQLLMLSGIGDPEVLRRAQVKPIVNLPGVGRNLQDRYEVAVVNRMRRDWRLLEGATFRCGDKPYMDWQNNRHGAYTTNGSLVSVIQRSTNWKPVPDLFCYALLADFRGYHPQYAEQVAARKNILTWVVLKGHTNNVGGRVTIESPDPRRRPAINFHYFDEGTDSRGEDLDSVVEGIKLVRRMTEGMNEIVEEEEAPGRAYSTDEQLKAFARDRAWGHHASCTCPIGARSHGGVLTSDFKVHGVERLRVVDASVFPRIPGLFIVSAIYMIGEKAADVIAKDASALER
jgi:choline dehydrogenase-like flavoprotein